MTIRMMIVLLGALSLGACSAPTATAYDAGSERSRALQGVYYVTAAKSPVHLGPHTTARVTSTLYRQQRVDVLEVQGVWARVTKYYDGAAEGVYRPVARWVVFEDLDTERPDDLSQRDLPGDPRIELPKVGENALTERDVRILYAAAFYYLESGKLKRIEWGDKSLYKPGYYYLSSGPKNHFFRPRDIPNLEQRIQELRSAGE